MFRLWFLPCSKNSGNQTIFLSQGLRNQYYFLSYTISPSKNHSSVFHFNNVAPDFSGYILPLYYICLLQFLYHDVSWPHNCVILYIYSPVTPFWQFTRATEFMEAIASQTFTDCLCISQVKIKTINWGGTQPWYFYWAPSLPCHSFFWGR